MEDLLTVKEAAARKGVSEASIYSAVREGRLSAVKQYGRTLFREEDVAAYQPGSYGGIERAKVKRGPGRSKKQTEAV